MANKLEESRCDRSPPHNLTREKSCEVKNSQPKKPARLAIVCLLIGKKYALEEFRIGLFVELEDGMDEPTTDLTDEEMQSTAKIVLEHLDEQPDYYTEQYHMFAESADASF